MVATKLKGEDPDKGKLSAQRVIFGFVLPVVLQSVLTATIGLLGIKRHWNVESALYLSFVITSGFGFALLTRKQSAKEKTLVALGYFPLMSIVAWVTGILILLNLPGAQGNF